MKFRAALVSVCVLAGVSGAFGQSLEDRLRDQLRQTTDQLRQVQDGQAALQAQKAAAEQERDALKKQVAELQEKLSHNRPDTAVQGYQQQVAKDKEALAQASHSIQEAQREHERLQSAVTNQATMLSACEQKNADLLKLGNEILDRFEHFDVADAVSLSEPFVQQDRVQLEKLAQDYGDRLYDGKFDPRTVKPPRESAQTGAAPAAAPKQ
jgi:chromosome segregation ATPase